MKKPALTASFVILLLAGFLYSSPQPDKSFNKEIEKTDGFSDQKNILESIFMPHEPEGLSVFQKAYSDIGFSSSYDKDVSDWKIILTIPRNGQTVQKELYWADGSFLPKEELQNKDQHWTLLYSYPKELKNPDTFTAEEIEEIRQFSSPDNRQNGAGTPQYFFDAVYDCKTRISVEQHIKKTLFLGKQLNVHERIVPLLKKIEKEIRSAAKTDREVQNFIDDLYQTDGYYWRTIRDTNRKSFHSIGIAVDILPHRWGHKIIYWNWQAEIDPENWMLTPLKDRWMPPEKVIRIFEKHGFIWGGKWAIWDDMHFEYHPELILFNKINSFF